MWCIRSIIKKTKDDERWYAPEKTEAQDGLWWNGEEEMMRRSQPPQRRPMQRAARPVAPAVPVRRANGKPMPARRPMPEQRPMNRGARQEVQMQDGSRRPAPRRTMR